MVFEAQLVSVLQRYLGTYVHGLSKEALSVSVWKGDVELRNLKLRAEALNALDLPISVKAGFLGSITLKVPWNRLGQEPVIVLLDRIFLIAEPYTGAERAQVDPDEEDVPAVFESKRRRIEEAELQYVKKKGKATQEAQQSSGWLQGLISTIVGNLKLSVTNVHVRYEDGTSNPGHFFAMGFTLAKLAAVTVDEDGNETFATSNALDRLRKSVEMSRLAVYADPDSEPFRVRKPWDELTPDEWAAIFERGIRDDDSLAAPVAVLERSGRTEDDQRRPLRHYLLRPVSLGARYSKLSSQEIERRPDVPLHKASATLEDVTLTLEQAQFRDAMKLLESFNKYSKLQSVAHLRPRKKVREDPRAWWRFALKGVKQQVLKHRATLDWQDLVHLSQLRRKYIPLYGRLLTSAQPGQNVGDKSEIKSMDREIPVETAALWRIIAHKQADQVARRRAREEAERRQEASKSWWSYIGLGGGGSKGQVDRPEALSEEEWAKIQQLVGLDEPGAADLAARYGQEALNMLQVELDVTFRRSQVRLLGRAEDDEVLRLGSEGFLVGAKVYPQMKVVRVGLERYGVHVPEGRLLQSVLRRDVKETVSLEFVLAPINRPDLDWSLAATCAPAHITIWRASVDRVLDFFQAGRAASPAMVQDTAAALQVKLEEARKSAAQQLQAAMKQKPRFSIDLDLDAPKVAIPTSYLADEGGNTQLLVDLGHFNVRTDDDPTDLSKEEIDLYTRFKLNATDISAFLSDGDWDWEARAPLQEALECKTGEDSQAGGRPEEEKAENSMTEKSGLDTPGRQLERPDTRVLSLLDNTGLTVALHQIFMPHPRYPTTRVALRVPLLGFHFSPARYHRLMAVVDAVLPKSEPEQKLDERAEKDGELRPWGPAELEGPVHVLKWEGLTRTQATWKPAWGLLAGVYLYLLDHKDADSYMHYTGLIGKQVRDVPPDKIQGCEHVVAVMDPGASIDSIAQATNAVVLRFDSEARKEQWKAAMQNAVYRASAPAALTLLSSDSSSEEGSEFDATSQPEHEETPGGIPPSRANTPEGRLVEAAGETKRDREELNPALQQSIFLVGVLDILRVDVDGSRKGGEEFPLLQVRASGTRVEMVQRMYDTSVGMVLQSVEIEDLLHGGTAPECRFLARSFLAAREDLDRSKSEEAQALEALEKESGWKEVDDEGGSGRTARAESEKGREGTEKEPGDDSKRRERAKGARPPRADNGNRGAEAESGGTRSGGEGGPKRDAGESARSRGKEEAAGISITEKAEKGMQSPRSPAGEVEKLDGDDFYDAASTLSRSDSSRSGRSARSGRSPSLGPRTVSSHGSIYFDAPEGGASPRGRRLELLPPSFKESGILELEEKEDEEETGGKESTFVKVVAIMRQTQSPEYRGVDTKVVLDMATLDFFLNRPTVLALMDFAEQITEPPKGEKSGAGALDKGKEKVGGEEERQHEGRGDEGADIKEGTAKGESKETAKGGTEGGEITGTVVSKIEPAALEGATSAEKPAVISGLLGHGKSRVVFGLEVRMQRVQVVLNQDQGGTPLAVLAMLDLSNEVRVFPSSFAVKAELGSLRISDARLGEGHPYGEMFGMQSAAGGSFIMASFESYDPGEDEYFGYDYSLCVRLAAVRTVILYRFVQELSAYFMDLIPPGTGAETEKQLRATVAGVEQWIQQSDVHGQPAIQLDVQMEKPVILMPECSDSKGYIELAIERIALSNEAQWKGGQGEEDMAAVRLDVMTLSIEGLGLRVGGEGGQVGHEIVEEASGLQVVAVRPLRDVLKQVPAIDITVAVDKLKAGMASSEYEVISQVALTNLSEEPHLPPKLRDNEAAPGGQKAAAGQAPQSETTEVPEAGETGLLPEDEEKLQEVEGGVGAGGESGGGEKKGQPWASVRVTVDVRSVEVELYTSDTRETSLALVQMEGLWAAYRMTTSQVSVINASLLRLHLLDLRDSTDDSMRFLVGSTVEVDPDHPLHAGAEAAEGSPLLTLLVVDAQIAPDSITVSVRLQRPRVLVVVDFLLAVFQFFLPHMAMLPGGGVADEGKGQKLDPLGTQHDIRLRGGLFEQPEEELALSPRRQLVADRPGVAEYVYDGKGGTLVLKDQLGEVLHTPPATPLIIIGPGKNLRFRNVTIRGAAFLDWAVQLGACSSYTVEEADGVTLEASRQAVAQAHKVPRTEQRLIKRAQKGPEEAAQAQQQQQSPPVKMLVHAQIYSPELTFYDSTPWPSGSVVRPERLLRVKMDAHATLSMRGNDMWARGLVNGLTVEASNGVSVMEPLTATAELTTTGGKQLLAVALSPVAVHLSFTTLRLLLRLQADILETLQLTSSQFTVKCTQFDRIWLGKGNAELPSSRPLSVWRPRVPPGYSSLGDCLVTGPTPPSKAVLALSTAFSRTRKPVRLERVYTSPTPPSDEGTSDELGECYSIWRPVAPPGYVTVGYVVAKGTRQPPPGVVWCAREDLVTSAAVGDCLYSQEGGKGPDRPPLSLWHIENSAGTFLLLDRPGPAPVDAAFDLRDMLRFVSLGQAAPRPDAPPLGGGAGLSRLPSRQGASGAASSLPSLEDGDEAEDPAAAQRRKVYQVVAELRRVWWSKGIPGIKPVSIWRPVPPAGSAIFGDVAVTGFEPPAQGITVVDDGSDRWAPPEDYDLCIVFPHPNSKHAVSIWWPRAPPVYHALGCVACPGTQKPGTSLVRCARRDLLRPVGTASPPLVDTFGVRGLPELGVWRVQNEMNTFLVSPDHDPPPPYKAFALKDLSSDRPPDTLALEAKLGSVTLTVYDDFGGLMTPLLEAGLRTSQVTVHGRPEMLNAVVATAVAAATFNPGLDVWEPVIEPWEAMVRCEYVNDPSELSLPGVTRLRLQSSSAVNVNASSATVGTLVDAVAAYNKVTQMEEDAKKEGQKRVLEKGKLTTERSALDQKSKATVAVENQLGRDMWVRVVESSSEESTGKVVRLPSGRETRVALLPPQTLRRTSSSRSSALLPSERNGTERLLPRTRRFAAVRVGSAEGLPPASSVNTQEFLSALRLVTTGPPAAGSASPALGRHFVELLQHQSARTRCVRGRPNPETPDLLDVRWDEVFLFELPPEGEASVDVVVTNQGANGGRGAVVGGTTVPVPESNAKDAPIWSPEWLTLKTSNGEENGRVSVAVQLVGLEKGEGSGAEKWKRGKRVKREEEGPGGLQLGLGEDGPWSSLRSVIPVGAFVRTVGGIQIVVQVDMANGRKHVTLRSPAVLFNDSTVPLEASVVPRALRDADDEENDTAAPQGSKGDREISGPLEVEEEIFENERLIPCVGWSNAFLPTDPGHWTNRDNTQSEPEFKDPPLPPGWEWAGDWELDTSGNVDYDGWAYACNFQQLRRWPPRSPKYKFKKCFDFVRRRRWVRVRRRVLDESLAGRVSLGVVESGKTLPLPWTAVDPSKDLCLQVRPMLGTSPDVPAHRWAEPAEEAEAEDESPLPLRPLSTISGGPRHHKRVAPSEFVLRELSPTTQILESDEITGRGAKVPGKVWLCLAVRADKLQRQTPGQDLVNDWKLRVSPVISLENGLPEGGQFTVYEKPPRASLEPRQSGEVDSGQQVGILAADVRRPVFLKWEFDGWQMDKDSVLISHPDKSPERLLSLTHRDTNRHLRLGLDFQPSDGELPRLIRLYAPFWLQVRPGLELSIQVVKVSGTVAGGKGRDHWIGQAIARVNIAKRIAERKENKQQAKQNQVAPADVVSFSRVAKVLEDLGDVTPSEPVLLSRAADEKAGLCVRMAGTDADFGPALALAELEEHAADRVEMMARGSDGSYMNVMVGIESCPLKIETTRVIMLQPHTLLSNQYGQTITFRQEGTEKQLKLDVEAAAVPLIWTSSEHPERMEVRVGDLPWSRPFRPDEDGTLTVLMGNLNSPLLPRLVRIEIRSVLEEARFLVTFRRPPIHPPYRLENRTGKCVLEYRQGGLTHESKWAALHPHSAVAFVWEDKMQEEKRLEVRAVGGELGEPQSYDLERLGRLDSLPVPGSGTSGGPPRLEAFLYVEGPERVLRFVVPEGDRQVVTRNSGAGKVGELASDWVGATPEDTLGASQASAHLLDVSLDVPELGLSVIDHIPQELLYCYVAGLQMGYTTGLGKGVTRTRLQLRHFQVDNQLPWSPLPVLLAPEPEDAHSGAPPPWVLQVTIISKEEPGHTAQEYPYIGLHTPDIAWNISVHEPIVWRLLDLYEKLGLDRLGGSPEAGQQQAATVDPYIGVHLLDFSEHRLKLTVEMAPGQRPPGALGVWGPLLTAIGNTNAMHLVFHAVVRENLFMRRSEFVNAMIAHVARDLLSQPLRLLTGVDVLGNTSSTLGQAGRILAEVSMDRVFVRRRNRAERMSNVEGLGSGIKEGARALGRALARGIYGTVARPLQGASRDGLEGFSQGCLQGFVGCFLLPASGCLDLASKTTDGIDTTWVKLLSGNKGKQRVRLPRAFTADGVLRPYDEEQARGQAVLHAVQLKHKVALTDFYEAHFWLVKQRTLIITNHRMLLVQGDTVLWTVTWEEYLAIELADVNPDVGARPPRVIVHLRRWQHARSVFERKALMRSIRCQPGTSQVRQVYAAIKGAYAKFRPQEKETVTGTGLTHRRRPLYRAGKSGLRMIPDLDKKEPRGRAPTEITAGPSDSAAKTPVEHFELIWWNKDAQDAGAALGCLPCCSGPQPLSYHAGPVAIWRPVAPPGYVTLGNVLTRDFDPPNSVPAYRDDQGREEPLFATPADYDLIYRDVGTPGYAPLTLWAPRAADGFVPGGHVAVAGWEEPPRDFATCIRIEAAEPVSVTGSNPIWQPSRELTSLWPCNVWATDSPANTFIAHRGQDPPPPARVYKLRG